ncbi:hypothetical protein SAMN05216247_10245 [Pseudomonas salomonii]|uniref:Cytochrome c domain-containing protein n=1 Tax=Pseudomonas salomonii TaxID=191391 RepID=A0A1H3F7Y9_9PSED|nr:hypothetical protein SAMN05216247_10245 [Pseudomonas salomonii]
MMFLERLSIGSALLLLVGNAHALAGKKVFAEGDSQPGAMPCVACRGGEGQGQKVGDSYVMRPLWGKDSHNWDAGMHRINTAASFIRVKFHANDGVNLYGQTVEGVLIGQGIR